MRTPSWSSDPEGLFRKGLSALHIAQSNSTRSLCLEISGIDDRSLIDSLLETMSSPVRRLDSARLLEHFKHATEPTRTPRVHYNRLCNSSSSTLIRVSLIVPLFEKKALML